MVTENIEVYLECEKKGGNLLKDSEKCEFLKKKKKRVPEDILKPYSMGLRGLVNELGLFPKNQKYF